MIRYYGANKGKNFFQAWYFKLQCSSITICIVPKVIINKSGDKKVFIKIVCGDKKREVEYDFAEFSFDNGKIKIGENEFSAEGIKINIKNQELSVVGQIKFSRLVTLKKKIINSVKLIRFMQCNHEVISLRHYLNGDLKINNNDFNLINGIGYIETIYGKKNPEKKIWIQCSDKYNYSLMVSVEPVCRGKKTFLGCIAFVYCNGQEHKLATIKGGKIITYNKEGIVIKQGRKYLEVNIHNKEDSSLDKYTVDSLCSKASVLFKVGKKTMFSQNTNECSYRYNI